MNGDNKNSCLQPIKKKSKMNLSKNTFPTEKWLDISI